MKSADVNWFSNELTQKFPKLICLILSVKMYGWFLPEITIMWRLVKHLIRSNVSSDRLRNSNKKFHQIMEKRLVSFSKKCLSFNFCNRLRFEELFVLKTFSCKIAHKKRHRNKVLWNTRASCSKIWNHETHWNCDTNLCVMRDVSHMNANCITWQKWA